MYKRNLMASALVAAAWFMEAPAQLRAQSPDDAEVAAMVTAAKHLLSLLPGDEDRVVLLSRGVANPMLKERPRPGDAVNFPGTYSSEHANGVLNAVARDLGAKLQTPAQGVRCAPGPGKHCRIEGGDVLVRVGKLITDDGQTTVAVDVQNNSTRARTGVNSASFEVTLLRGPEGWTVLDVRLSAIT